MKKLTILAVTAIIALGATSCKKDYVCECTGNEFATGTYPMNNTKKSDAEDACKEFETAAKIADPDASCKLK